MPQKPKISETPNHRGRNTENRELSRSLMGFGSFGSTYVSGCTRKTPVTNGLYKQERQVDPTGILCMCWLRQARYEIARTVYIGEIGPFIKSVLESRCINIEINRRVL